MPDSCQRSSAAPPEAGLFTPPYYAVIFTSQLGEDSDGYTEMADRMVALAQQQPGFLGFESARGTLGISVSYWRELAAIRHWKSNLDHLQAQTQGREQWYSSYTLRIARVEREYSFTRP